MCHAIIRVLYQGNDRQDVKVETEDEMEKRIADLQSKDQVMGYTIYVRSKKVVRQTNWEEVP